jgi:uncharacterized protein YdiU (UPF0061 family)
MRQLSSGKEHSLGGNFDSWFVRYKARLEKETSKMSQRVALMQSVNPKYILRNYLAEVAIRKAEDLNEYDEIEILFQLLKKPFDSHEGYETYDSEPPEWAQNLELSCSS